MKLVLASESPTRRRALDILGLAYEIRPCRIDEKAIRHDDPRELVRLLAAAKAKSSLDPMKNTIVVAGDAIVSKAERIFEKPANHFQAEKFLHEFSGSTVEYVTAVAVGNSNTGKIATSVQSSRISFRNLSPGEIADYIHRYDVLTCAGAFESEGVVRFSRCVSGPCNYITGFSMNELVLMLRREGIAV
jgi:MAF protein